LPFGGHTTGEMLEAIFTKEPVAPVRLNSNVPAALERIISKAMEKGHNLRYQSAAEMRTDLQRLRRDTSLPQTARASSPQTRPGRRDAGATKLWIAVAAIVVVLLGIILLQTSATRASSRKDGDCGSAV